MLNSVYRYLQQFAKSRTKRKLAMRGMAVVYLVCVLSTAVQAQSIPELEPRGGVDIYVDLSNTSGIEDGTSTHPYNTIVEGTNAVGGGTVRISTGYYNEVLTLSKPMILQSNSGTVIIGRADPNPLHKVFLPLLFMYK